MLRRGLLLALLATASMTVTEASAGSAGRTITGTQGADRLIGTRGPDVIDGLGGNDLISGGRGDDTLNGGPGDDTIIGGAGDDHIDPGPGRDTVSGGNGDDVIHARDGEVDRITCGKGHDIVFADRIDRISRDCEDVRYPPATRRRR